MHRERAVSYEGLCLLGELLAAGAALTLSFSLRAFHETIPFLNAIPSTDWVTDQGVRAEYAILLVCIVATVRLYGKASGAYNRWRTLSLGGKVFHYARAVGVSILIAGALVFTLKLSLSRLFFGYFFVSLFFFLVAAQAAISMVTDTIAGSREFRRPVLVIGTRESAAWFAAIVERARPGGYQLIGFASAGLEKAAPGDGNGPTRLGRVEDLASILSNHVVEEVFVVGTPLEIATQTETVEALIAQGHVVSIVTTLGGSGRVVAGRISDFVGVPILSFGPMPRDEIREAARRTLDVGVALLAIVLMAPLGLLIGLAIKICEGGPVLFRQRRLGRGGQAFQLLKFRSMSSDAERILREDRVLYEEYVANGFKLPEERDPRITRIGRFLRKTSLDELPQLFNVLSGEMTLVGPRPIVPDEIENYSPYQAILLAAKPGLTGQWQVDGRSEIHYPERALLDLSYVAKNSLMKDVGILARTIPAVLRGRGAH